MLFVPVITIVAVLLGSVQSQIKIGDRCDLRDGSQGVCENFQDCPQALKDFKKGVLIKVCLSKGSKQIVCCQQLKATSRTSPQPTRIPQTTKSPKRSVLNPVVAENDSPKVPSNFVQKYFQKACENIKALKYKWQSFIIGGKRASLGDFPHMVAIGYHDADLDDIEFKCGGSIISSNYVLTAAHCSGRDLDPLFVRAGTVSIEKDLESTNYTDYQVEKVIKHPGYNATLKRNDIALIRLKTNIKFTQYIRPTCLQTDANDLPFSNLLYVSGWGYNGMQDSEFLLTTDLRTMDRAKCNTTLLDYGQGYHDSLNSDGVGITRYCAYDPSKKKDACQGDSGGPLQTHQTGINTVVGIISFGFGCANGLPGVYTRVAVYLDWIYSVVGSIDL